MAEIPALYGQRPIVLRHKKAAMYHSAIEAVALTVVDIPITFVISIIFGALIYFIVGLQASAGQFLYVSDVHSMAAEVLTKCPASIICFCSP
jgi:ATP-binding cassette subfamily G (WHITE) protein 2 (SNQ2)